MELMKLRIMQGEVAEQCQYALLAIQDINRALIAANQTDLWMAVQTFLGACANVSKACWGQGGSKADERVDLRTSLTVADDSPLRPTSFRNHFEHFDERVDRWWETSTNHNFVNHIIGPAGAIAGPDDGDMFKWFNPQSGEVVFWGDRFNVQVVAAEIQRILPVALTESRKPHWEPPPPPVPSSGGAGQ